MEAILFSETSVLAETTWHNIPEDSILNKICPAVQVLVRPTPLRSCRRHSKNQFSLRMSSSGLLRRMALVRTDVSEEVSAFIIRVTTTSVLTRPTRRNIPEGGILHSHRRENLKSYITNILSFLFWKDRKNVNWSKSRGRCFPLPQYIPHIYQI
jgi:hypothetical protein